MRTQTKRSRSNAIKSNPNKGAGAGDVLGRDVGLNGYQLAALGLTGGHATGGDITGNQGTGGGAVRLRRARAVGVGVDDDTRAANEFAAWANSSPARAEIGAGVRADADGWAALQWLGARAARNASRRMMERRSVTVSRTSQDDAAADAVAAVATAYPRGCLRLVNHRLGSGRFRILARIAGGAAWGSLSKWSVAGMTGRDAGKVPVLWSAVFDVVKDCIAADLTPLPFEGIQGAARRAVVRWVYRVGLVGFKAALPAGNAGARATAIQGARRRCRVVASVVMGQSLFDSCAVHGFGSVAAFVNSCERAGFFPALRAARARTLADCQAVEAHRVAARRYALDAAKSIRRLDGWQQATSPVAVSLAKKLFENRGEAVALAKFHRDAARRAAKENLAAFDKVLSRLSDESCDLSNLREVFRITDKLGRVRGASKIDGAGIRAGKGKVTRRAVTARTVALDVVTRYGARAIACAPLATS